MYASLFLMHPSGLYANSTLTENEQNQGIFPCIFTQLYASCYRVIGSSLSQSGIVPFPLLGR